MQPRRMWSLCCYPSLLMPFCLLAIKTTRHPRDKRQKGERKVTYHASIVQDITHFRRRFLSTSGERPNRPGKLCCRQRQKSEKRNNSCKKSSHHGLHVAFIRLILWALSENDANRRWKAEALIPSTPRPFRYIESRLSFCPWLLVGILFEPPCSP